MNKILAILLGLSCINGFSGEEEPTFQQLESQGKNLIKQVLNLETAVVAVMEKMRPMREASVPILTEQSFQTFLTKFGPLVQQYQTFKKTRRKFLENTRSSSQFEGIMDQLWQSLQRIQIRISWFCDPHQSISLDRPIKDLIADHQNDLTVISKILDINDFDCLEALLSAGVYVDPKSFTRIEGLIDLCIQEGDTDKIERMKKSIENLRASPLNRQSLSKLQTLQSKFIQNFLQEEDADELNIMEQIQSMNPADISIRFLNDCLTDLNYHAYLLALGKYCETDRPLPMIPELLNLTGVHAFMQWLALNAPLFQPIRYVLSRIFTYENLMPGQKLLPLEDFEDFFLNKVFIEEQIVDGQKRSINGILGIIDFYKKSKSKDIFEKVELSLLLALKEWKDTDDWNQNDIAGSKVVRLLSGMTSNDFQHEILPGVSILNWLAQRKFVNATLYGIRQILSDHLSAGTLSSKVITECLSVLDAFEKGNHFDYLKALKLVLEILLKGNNSQKKQGIQWLRNAECSWKELKLKSYNAKIEMFFQNIGKEVKHLFLNQNVAIEIKLDLLFSVVPLIKNTHLKSVVQQNILNSIYPKILPEILLNQLIKALIKCGYFDLCFQVFKMLEEHNRNMTLDFFDENDEDLSPDACLFLNIPKLLSYLKGATKQNSEKEYIKKQIIILFDCLGRPTDDFFQNVSAKKDEVYSTFDSLIEHNFVNLQNIPSEKERGQSVADVTGVIFACLMEFYDDVFFRESEYSSKFIRLFKKFDDGIVSANLDYSEGLAEAIDFICHLEQWEFLNVLFYRHVRQRAFKIWKDCFDEVVQKSNFETPIVLPEYIKNMLMKSEETLTGESYVKIWDYARMLWADLQADPDVPTGGYENKNQFMMAQLNQLS